MLNIHEEIKKFKKIHYESKLTQKEIGDLIFFLEVLIIRNNQIGRELKDAIENIETLRARVDFYRNTTLPKNIID